MTKNFSLIISLVAAYVIAWTVAYFGMLLSRGDTLDPQYYFLYFKMAWTFSGGELVTFIWIGSLIIFVPLAIILIWLQRKCSQKQVTLPHSNNGHSEPD